MKLRFRGKRIAGILNVIPESAVLFEDEVSNYNFPPKRTMQLKKIMGYKQHRIVKETTSTSDMCIYGLKHMLDNGMVDKNDIGAVIVITMTPDYFVPPTSNIIQGECDLPTDILCLDINQGCVGYIVGLIQSFMLLDSMKDKKVLLFNADVLSKKVSKQDRNSYPLIGDAATITVLENSGTDEEIYINIYMDGRRGDALIIPAGGSRLACSPETAVLHDDSDGNMRALDNLKMDGSEVFSFVQTEVPPLIEEIMHDAGQSLEDIDYFLFHQPNKFMLEKLADKIGIPREKIFMNIVENYGNPSGASIPVVITHNMPELLKDGIYNCCLSAFGSGLTWAAAIMKIGKLAFCKTLVSDL